MDELDQLLREWAAAINCEIEGSSYPKSTIISRLMELGPDGAAIRIKETRLPNYWPKPELVKLNDIIWSLPTEDRNIVVMKRILGNSYYEIGKDFSKSKSWAYKTLDKVEQNIRILLYQ